jgi:hypothetical protein
MSLKSSQSVFIQLLLRVLFQDVPTIARITSYWKRAFRPTTEHSVINRNILRSDRDSQLKRSRGYGILFKLPHGEDATTQNIFSVSAIVKKEVLHPCGGSSF